MRVSMAAAGVALLVIVPWIRNALTFGHFILLSTSGGLTRAPWFRLAPTLVELSATILAVFALIRQPRSIPARLLWASLAQVMVFGIWFEFSERHRLFMTPFIIMMAGMLLINSRRAQRSVGTTAPLIA